MAKRATSPDAILERLSALRQVPSSPEFLTELRKAIAHTSPVVVGRGAELAARYDKRELSPDLIAAFDRFNGSRARDEDKSFAARTAIVRGLADLYAGGEAADVYLAAVRMIGNAPPGGGTDSAADLRASAAFGLVTMVHPAALTVCTDLLADLAPAVRVAAARALAASGREGGALVMRLKLQIGDPEPEVLAECVTGLMQLLPAESLDVAVRMLRHRDEMVRAAAALAIGASKLPEVLTRLSEAFDREKEQSVRKTILIAAASTRSQAAIDWLVSLVSKDPWTAEQAIEALGPFRLDETVRQRVGKMIEEHGGTRLTDAYKQVFM